MSHNKVKIGTATPDASGELSVSLTDLNDVSGTPSEGELLQYSSGAWAPASVSGSSEIEYLWFGRGESEDYDYSPATSLGAPYNFYLYDTSPTNTITGATLSVTASSGAGAGSGDWLDSFTLPAGTYRFQVVANVEFSGTGFFKWSLYNTTTSAYVGNDGTVGAAGSGAPLAIAIIELTASTTFDIRIVSASSVAGVSSQGNTPSEYSSVLVERMA